MPRPRAPRAITALPPFTLFKPGGIRGLEQIVLSLDEFEAIRLSDAERLRQGEAAARMRVSRPTYGRIVRSARRKVAMALVRGLAVRIAGAQAGAPVPATGRCPFCARSCDAGAGDHCARCDEPLVRLPTRRGRAAEPAVSGAPGSRPSRRIGHLPATRAAAGTSGPR